jgi:hypothetical protein
MINVMTVHWRTAKWIEIQLDYLQRNIEAPFRVFAALNGIDDPALHERFHFAADLEGVHAEKLNRLAEIAGAESDPSDVLLFLDGDAFPVRPLHPWISDLLDHHQLAAVRRDENSGDPQPHPSFCITTVATWQKVAGDWREGGTWVNPEGEECTDVGGTLMHQLAEAGIDWHPLLRTNTYNPHPVWFGIYDHRIYHHGAGFRYRYSRADYYKDATIKPSDERPSMGTWRSKVRKDPASLLRLRPRHLRQAAGVLQRTAALRQEARKRRQLRTLAQDTFRRLSGDPDFFLDFDPTT